MPIRARVGRHTQLGGRHCQNWSDDQKIVIDLLNRISPANGGTGGSLKPRIVAGIASDELYAAIVRFENMYFPGQRSGFIDPDGPMWRKLVALTSTAPAKPAPPPPPPPPPPPLPRERGLTPGEISLLQPIFKLTLPYPKQRVQANDGNLGGEENSITPGDTPFLSTKIWCADFSGSSVNDAARGTFIHEFTHVWQYYHGITKLSVIGLAIWHFRDYKRAYPYDLSDNDDFTDYNVEQQAAIVEDYYYLTKGYSPDSNVGPDKSLATYTKFVDQMRDAGLPHTPAIPPIPRFRH